MSYRWVDEYCEGFCLRMRHLRLNCTGLVFVAMILLTQAVSAQQFYKFKDKNGRVQIQDSIPAEYVKYGYKVVNERGITIDIVASEREQRKILRDNRRRQKADTLAERERAEKKESDERLFHSFSNAEEIRQAGNKKIMVVQGQIETTTKHIEAFKRNLIMLEEQKAEGGKYDDDAMQKLRHSIGQNNAFIKRKRKEQNDIRDEYLGYIQRYQMISIN